jgi:hypothetical protein
MQGYRRPPDLWRKFLWSCKLAALLPESEERIISSGRVLCATACEVSRCAGKAARPRRARRRPNEPERGAKSSASERDAKPIEPKRGGEPSAPEHGEELNQPKRGGQPNEPEHDGPPSEPERRCRNRTDRRLLIFSGLAHPMDEDPAASSLRLVGLRRAGRQPRSGCSMSRGRRSPAPPGPLCRADDPLRWSAAGRPAMTSVGAGHR